MDESGGDDYASAELLDGHQNICTNTPNHELVQEQGSEDTDGAGDENYEERTNSQSDIVLALAKTARDPFALTANTVPVTVVSNRKLSIKSSGSYSTPAWKWQFCPSDSPCDSPWASSSAAASPSA